MALGFPGPQFPICKMGAILHLSRGAAAGITSALLATQGEFHACWVKWASTCAGQEWPGLL